MTSTFIREHGVCALLLAAFGALAGCGPDVPGEPAATSDKSDGDKARVTGTLMYRERMALPPGAVAEVWLLDTSIADVPAIEVAYDKLESPGTPPIPFVLEYEPSKIDERMQYGVRAAISYDGQLLFTSDTHYPVLTRGAGNTVDIMLIMVERDR